MGKLNTLSHFQQSELKRFEKLRFPDIDADFYKYSEKARADYIVDTLKSFLKTAIEKAYVLGKEEKGKKITKKQVLDWLFDHDRDLYYQLLKNK